GDRTGIFVRRTVARVPTSGMGVAECSGRDRLNASRGDADMGKKAFTGQFVAAGVLLNVGIGPAWAADPAGSGSSAPNPLSAQVAQAAIDQPPQPGEQPAAPTAMTIPAMAGPLAANPNPISFDAGPLRPV